jgi:hypothetical protein
MPVEPASAVVAGKAVAKVAGKAMQEDPKDRDILRQIAEKSGELEPAARAYAKRLAVKEQIRLKIWQPLGRLVGIQRDYFEFQFAEDMADRLVDVPEEELTTPRGSLAGPALQGLGFTVEEPELRDMYLNLLATASDRRIASSAHPSFSEVIRQLTPEEARALPDVLGNPDLTAHPIIEIRRSSMGDDGTPGEGFLALATHVLAWQEDDGTPIAAPERALWVDNWMRLGLVDVDYSLSLTGKDAYKWAETTPLVVAARGEYDTPQFIRVSYQKGRFRVTDFGQAFGRAVLSFPTPGAETPVNE